MTSKAEEVASKLVGGAKSAMAALEGLTGVFRHLEKEHGEVSALLVRLQTSSDPGVRRELLPTIRVELLAHERAEIAVVYPALRSDPQTETLANEHDADAKSLEAAIAALMKVAVDSPHWPAALKLLVQRVQHHVHEEENEYFPTAERVLKDRTHELLEQFEAAKVAAKRDLTSTP